MDFISTPAFLESVDNARLIPWASALTANLNSHILFPSTPPAHLNMSRRLRATPRCGRASRGNANELARTLSTIVNTNDFDVRIPNHLRQIMNDSEDECLGSLLRST